MEVPILLTPMQLLLIWTLLGVLLAWLVVFTLLAVRPMKKQQDDIEFAHIEFAPAVGALPVTPAPPMLHVVAQQATIQQTGSHLPVEIPQEVGATPLGW